MKLNDFISWYENISRNKFQNKYSPHKPLTILFAISKVLQGKRWVSYRTDREDLEKLIWDQTNLPSKPNCLYPLHRLCRDARTTGFWIESPTLSENESGDISGTEAQASDYKAGFSDEVYEWLHANIDLSQLLVDRILTDNFPETLHEEIFVSLALDQIVPAVGDPKVYKTYLVAQRDPNFPKEVMRAYDCRCAVCGLKINISSQSLPMEAAHIKWKTRGGECIITNGISLCPTHHYAFDKGVWSIDLDYNLILSSKAIFDVRLDRFFTPFKGRSIANYLLDPKLLPSKSNIQWHHESIFKK